MHMFLGVLSLGKRLDWYISSGLVEIHNIKRRHDELAQEMVMRGYCHNSLMNDSSLFARAGFVEVERGYEELQSRCAECRRRILKT
jgi:hypothetical protein